MKRSTDKMLTTHTGALPRPDYVVDLVTVEGRANADPKEFASKVREGVADIVGKQVEHGVTVLNDGEMSKESYSTYIRERLSGFDGEGETAIGLADLLEYPAYLDRFMRETMAASQGVMTPPACNGPISVKDRDQVKADIDNLKAATANVDAADVFMSAASPGVVALFFSNHHYPDRESYVMAIAEAMKYEYEAIAAAGFLVQLDCPDLAMGRHIQFADASLEEFREQARLNVAALNHATANIAPDQMRMHLCWGNYEGPHHRDVELKDIVDIVFSARPNAISLEACNPRHDHEWALFEDVKLPDGKVLMPGVIDSTNNYIEHPELIAQRIIRYAKLVGKENVIASSDCGFGTAAGMETVDPGITWAKFDAMAEGARLADQAL